MTNQFAMARALAKLDGGVRIITEPMRELTEQEREAAGIPEDPKPVVLADVNKLVGPKQRKVHVSDDFRMAPKGSRGRRELRSLKSTSVVAALIRATDPTHLAKFQNRRHLDVVASEGCKASVETTQ